MKFELIGYCKDDNNARYKTFYVNLLKNNSDSLTEDVYNSIKKHGSQQMNTPGQISVSFYYFDRRSVPDITMLAPNNALDFAHEQDPFATVWILPTGKVDLIKRPKNGW